MKKISIIFSIFSICLLVFPLHCFAKDFLGIPIIPGSKIVRKSTKRVEFVCNMGHDKILRFYEMVLKGKKDIKKKKWKNATYIEDDGNRKWHSITIYRSLSANGTLVVIKKDSWTWIIGTLILRFIGVFVVLMTLFLALSLSGRIISTIVKRVESKKEASQ